MTVPTRNTRPDWYRLAANAINRLTNRTDWTTLGDFADDTAAASGGVPVGSLYRTGSTVKVRVS